MREQPRLWDSYSVKSPNLGHQEARSQNKALRRASQLQTSTFPSSDRQARQSELDAGNCSPREALSTKLQAGFIANQDFLGFWMVDICQEGCSQRSAPQKRHKAHLRWARMLPPRKLSGWDKEVIRRTPHLGSVRLQSTWLPELLGPGKGTKHRPN